MSLKNRVNRVHCKRADDVLVVAPGPRAQETVDSLIKGVACGHPHLIVVGDIEYMRRAKLPPMQDAIRLRAIAAYQIYPLAKVFVDALANQLGVAVDDMMAADVLGHPELLDLLARGQEKLTAKGQAPAPALFGADGKRLQ